MNKIPVFRTIGGSYAYAIAGYFRTLGVLWLPVVLQLALTFYLLGPFYQHMAAGDWMAYARDPHMQASNFLLQCVNLIVLSIIAVGITKEVLGLRKGFRFFYIGFGGDELRVIVAYLALFLLFLVFIIAYVIVFGIAVGIVAAVAGGAPQATRAFIGLGAFALIFASWLALIFVMVRLSFLIVPATVVEKRIGILRSWELTRGNFWRIFWIGFFIVLPFVVLGFFVAYQLLGQDFAREWMAHGRDPIYIQKLVEKRLQLAAQNLPLIFGIGLILNPLAYGLFYAPPALAYRALVPLPREAMPPPAPEPEEKPDLPPEIEQIVSPPADETH